MENGCKWRSLPKEYGDWHVIYVRMNCWAKNGVLQAAFLRLQQLGIIQDFQSMEQFKLELIEYLDYYNNHRIKAKLKGLPPALHRQQALSAA